MTAQLQTSRLPSQLPLPGFALSRLDNFFLAIQPDAAAATRFFRLGRQLQAQHGLTGKALEPRRFHVSLLNLTRYAHEPRSVLALAGHAAATISDAVVAGDAPRCAMNFAVTFNKVQSFRGRSRSVQNYPIVATAAEGTEELQSLNRTLASAIERVVRLRTLPVFTPHVTLLYDKTIVPAHSIEPIGWNVREFVLVQSHVGQNRPYTVLGRWSLHG